ncbi:MAG: prenyltransferase [Myxococcota bacterium]
MSVISNWMEALQTTNLAPGVEADPISRWLILSRASVLPMTLFAGAVGGLLALPGGGARLDLWALCTLGLLLAHVSNNLINDHFDLRSGLDTPDYARAQYAPHPVLSGMISPRGLVVAIVVVTALGALIALGLTWVRGWTAAAFALGGFAISFFYVAPPLRLKHRGLGEPAVFVVWGPLMIAGTYFVTTGELPSWVWWASLPYGLLVMTVLFGKHIDKLDSDRSRGIRTLPVRLGAVHARRTAQGLIATFFLGTLALVATGVLGLWTLVVLGALPRALEVGRVFSRPAPPAPPEGYPIWPLWYVAWAFVLIRRAGSLLVVGLALNALRPLYL